MKFENKKFKSNKGYLTKYSWEDFRKTGLLAIVNQFLHIFGWAIVVEMDENGTVTEVYPARCAFRGFPELNMAMAYEHVSEYIKDNADELLSEAKREDMPVESYKFPLYSKIFVNNGEELAVPDDCVGTNDDKEYGKNNFDDLNIEDITLKINDVVHEIDPTTKITIKDLKDHPVEFQLLDQNNKIRIVRFSSDGYKIKAEVDGEDDVMISYNIYK